MKTLFHLSIVTAFLLTSCATDPEIPSLYAGMSRDRLKTRFGEPIRIEHPKGGGEDWYYTFTSPPAIVGSSNRDEQNHTESAAIGISESLGNREQPVHISPDGFVTAPLPRGHLVR